MNNRSENTFLLVVIIIITLALMVVFGLIVVALKVQLGKDPSGSAGSTTTAARDREDSSEEATEAGEGTEDTGESSESTSEQTDQVDPAPLLPYTDNSFCDVSSNLNPDAFAYVSNEEGGYSFYYPKYVFNQVRYDPATCGYSFSYEENGKRYCAMNIYRELSPGTDPITRAKDFRRRFDALYDTVPYYWPAKDLEKLTSDPESEYKEPRSDGYTRYIMSGWPDPDKRERLYVLGADDRSTSYFLEFYYPDREPDNELEDWDYIVECVYRKASFSGTNYKTLRSWETFAKEGYGQGHH